METGEGLFIVSPTPSVSVITESICPKSLVRHCLLRFFMPGDHLRAKNVYLREAGVMRHPLVRMVTKKLEIECVFFFFLGVLFNESTFL